MSHKANEVSNDKLSEILELLEDGLDELTVWSAYNEDRYNEQINELRRIIDEIKL